MSHHKDTTTIKIGDRTFEVSAFDIDQLEKLTPHFLYVSKPLSDGGFAACCSVVRVGLELQGLIKAGELIGIKTTINEIRDAATEMGRVSGLYVEQKPGEPKAARSGTD